MAVPYESSGRRGQKSRTRDALVAATRALLAAGTEPTVEDVATAAGVSRATAYRYFPDQRSLLLGAHPETLMDSLLPADAPSDPLSRLDLVMQEFTRTTMEWEPQLRSSLRLSLEPGVDQPTLRGGRAIRWIEDALTPLGESHPGVNQHRLAVAIRSATGIETLVWLTDIAGLSRAEAATLMQWTARALLDKAIGGGMPTDAGSEPGAPAGPSDG